ncbi:hypothetical protein Droror1_Dr00005714 [Drosera rotundifolia]
MPRALTELLVARAVELVGVGHRIGTGRSGDEMPRWDPEMREGLREEGRIEDGGPNVGYSFSIQNKRTTQPSHDNPSIAIAKDYKRPTKSMHPHEKRPSEDQSSRNKPKEDSESKSGKIIEDLESNQQRKLAQPLKSLMTTILA